MNKCPICSKETKNITGNINHKNKIIKIFNCKACDFEFLDIWTDVNFVKSLYEGENYIFTHNISSDKNIELKFDEYESYYQKIKPYLNKNVSFFEIGCGDGKFLRKVKDNVKEIECVEISPPQVEKLRKEGFVCHDKMIEDLIPKKKYDIICLFAVLEHVPNLKDFIKRLKLFLNKDGLVFIGVPNANNVLFSSLNIKEFRSFYYRIVHLYYFNPHSLQKVLENEGFKVDISTFQQASITNHFHWIHKKYKQKNANQLTSINFPEHTNSANEYINLLNDIDDLYRKKLNDNKMGDLLFAKCELN